jgi:hypothetical protein
MMTNKLLYTVYDYRALGLTTCYISSVLILHKSWHYLLFLLVSSLTLIIFLLKKLIPFFKLNPPITMPSTKHLKAKERLALVLRIKNSNKKANSCSYCLWQLRRCLIDLKKSSYYSKYICLKRLYNLLGLKTVSII